MDLKKSALRYNFITPRDFLDFINHFIGEMLNASAPLLVCSFRHAEFED